VIEPGAGWGAIPRIGNESPTGGPACADGDGAAAVGSCGCGDLATVVGWVALADAEAVAVAAETVDGDGVLEQPTSAIVVASKTTRRA
jgi:hypothetical protein